MVCFFTSLNSTPCNKRDPIPLQGPSFPRFPRICHPSIYLPLTEADTPNGQGALVPKSPCYRGSTVWWTSTEEETAWVWSVTLLGAVWLQEKSCTSLCLFSFICKIWSDDGPKVLLWRMQRAHHPVWLNRFTGHALQGACLSWDVLVSIEDTWAFCSLGWRAGTQTSCVRLPTTLCRWGTLWPALAQGGAGGLKWPR